MMLRRRAEVPDVRIAVAGEQGIASELVARPLADHGAGGIADVVLIEGEQRTETGAGQHGACTGEAIIVEAAKVDPLLEIDLRMTGRLNRPRPVVVRIDVVGTYDLGLDLALALCRHRLLRNVA